MTEKGKESVGNLKLDSRFYEVNLFHNSKSRDTLCYNNLWFHLAFKSTLFSPLEKVKFLKIVSPIALDNQAQSVNKKMAYSLQIFMSEKPPSLSIMLTIIAINDLFTPLNKLP